MSGAASADCVADSVEGARNKGLAGFGGEIARVYTGSPGCEDNARPSVDGFVNGSLHAFNTVGYCRGKHNRAPVGL